MGRQGQPRGAQGSATHLCDWKGGSQDPPLPRPLLRVGSGGEGILLEIPVYLRPSAGKQLLSFISVSMAVAFEQVLACCSLGPCYSAVIAVLSIMLQCYTGTWLLLQVGTGHGRSTLSQEIHFSLLAMEGVQN